jgi:hypothetical protein
MTPSKAGIPYLIVDGGGGGVGQSYRLADGYVLDRYTWMQVKQEGDKFFFRRGHVLTDLDHDFMVFAYPYDVVQVTASWHDEFAKERAVLPRWTRTRWLAVEDAPGGIKNSLNLAFYDFRADKPVSPTSQGIKKISRVMESGVLSFMCHPDADALLE